ncbi:MAG: 50S ribosomal protein L6 [Candidatus Komeilibacteria bacterium RIFCSPLOWO2_02_FULL_48_11]|uniref:Large ribosomal subunit protein uL6 n=1 Tax=Candidatus Komeilibacteria bacterium RIFCSPLOWO2_02_FULL_48_11 TaxID=1798553 RepID=A0A1G2BSC2_9BACT|nr:MAG: 50S ribosomal protein L6 [Candidatus Komeilibacteria bacterium RIFCSPLOWO2_02_FULL_48_11]
MSRIGKKPIILPEGVSCELKDGIVAVKGPKGELSVALPPKVKLEKNGQEITFTVPVPENSRQASFWGLARTLVANAAEGVQNGYSKQLDINGVGYKIALQGPDLNLSVGFSHPVEFKAPQGITLAVEGNVITVSGIDKQLVGETAAQIRAIKPVEPYKGKGIKYVGEYVRRKAGKVVKGSTG